MNHYQVKNTADKIEGYMSVTPGKSAEERFADAQAELIAAYQLYIEQAKNLTFKQFIECYPKYGQNRSKGI